MCMMCQGMSAEQFETRISGFIEQHGYAVIFVEDKDPRQAFAYTVGLTKVGQPEFLVRGVNQSDTFMMLDRLAHDVLGGEYYAHGHTAGWKDQRVLYFADQSDAGKYALNVFHRYGVAAKVLEIHLVDRYLLERTCARHRDEILGIEG